MATGASECYGFAVEWSCDDRAQEMMERFFGRRPSPCHASTHTRVRVAVTGADAPAPQPPPYFPNGWESAEPIVIDLGRSRAVVSPADSTVDVELAHADVGDPVVWGRWLLEKAFLMLALRSPGHYGLHAGAVGIGDRAVIVTAESGVGKSTFCAWAMREGAVFAGDEALIRHLHEEPGIYWGYARAAYLAPELIDALPQLACARTAPVPARSKLRVEWPEALEARLAPRIRATALLVLTRTHAEIRPLTVGAAAAHCREDFSAGKQDRAALERVEEEVRNDLERLQLLEFGLGPDLDANYRRLREIL